MTTRNEYPDNAELKRRIRRVLSVLRSIATHMNTQAQDPRDSALHLAGRVGAIGRAAVAPVSSGMDLESLVLDELVAYGAQRAPTTIRGPTVRLRPKAAEWMSLAIHELATNSVKYGALSQSQAQLCVVWWVTEQPRSRLHFEWVEHGVRMSADAGRKPGFGSVLLQHLIESELRGSGEMLFMAEGVLCRIEIPLGEALHSHE
jgi:two-component system, chemotaxis family, CheB/CheR fusion protein